jgi:pimeloyl-ACP methyl ester carboxylesterase
MRFVFALVATLLAGCASNSAPSPSTPGSGPGPDTAPGHVATPVEATVASADGVPIHYVSVGDGETGVVLVHCWGCNLHFWDGAMGALAPRRRVVAMDLAGHGSSGRGRKEWSVHAFAEDVRAVVEAAKLKRVVLVGHSMGGPIIVETAQLLPGRVIGLVPIDTMRDMTQTMAPDKLQAFFAPMHADFKAMTEKVVRKLFPPDADPALVQRVLADELGQDPTIAVPMLEASFGYDAGQALSKIDVPVRSINSDLGPTNVEGNRRFAHDFDVIVMKGVGHWPMLERPAEFQATLVKVVDGLMPSR